MSIINLLSKKRKIVGIEINDSSIRLSYFKTRKNHNKKSNIPKEEIVFIDEPLEGNIVSNGTILEKESLAKILKNIWHKEKLSKCYAIVSIQEDKFYSKIFSFPKNIKEDKLKEGINLAINFQLPFKKDDFYIDWEKIENDSPAITEVIVSSIPKNITNDYVDVFNKADIQILALESNIFSICHLIQYNINELILSLKQNKESVSIFCFSNNSFKFSRTIPILLISDEDYLKNEISKIKNWAESEFNNKVKEIDIKDIQIKDEYKKYNELENGIDAKWLPSMGAMMRGRIPEGNDNKISLLPVRTIEAYKYQKAKVFISFARNIVIGISLFFVFAYLATYLFIFSLVENINKKSNIEMSSISSDILEKEALIKNVNNLTEVSESFLLNATNWSILIDEINSKTIEGIVISKLSIPSVNDTINIVGISKNRDTLNQFKKSLEKSILLANIELPITNLEQKIDIPFTISFKLKDPNVLYYK